MRLTRQKLTHPKFSRESLRKAGHLQKNSLFLRKKENIFDKVLIPDETQFLKFRNFLKNLFSDTVVLNLGTKSHREKPIHIYRKKSLTVKMPAGSWISRFDKFTVKDGTYLRLSKIAAVAGALLILFTYVPQAWYGFIFSFALDKTAVVAGNDTLKDNKSPTGVFRQVYQPQYDPNLPKENLLIISTIGIKTQIREATNNDYEDALRQGVWRVWDFGVPTTRGYPVILTAHRYGYLNWSIPYRLKNSFYKLPKLSQGEKVEIIWNQRKYTYLVYKEEKGEEISDYSADLILYTCENLRSPVRVFKYARLLEV